jgi:probable phosphoglycerate mutase
MTAFLLIRHAAHDWLGKTLIGRARGFPLNDVGRSQAAQLGQRLAGISAAVYSSPMERCRETAELLAAPERSSIYPEDAFNEVDFGEWTGSSFEALESDPRWHRWNKTRSTTGAPGGERMTEVQDRVLAGLLRLVGKHPGEIVAVVSHGDLIKAALCHFLSLSLDEIHSLEVEPACVSVLTWDAGLTDVSLVNDDGRGVVAALPVELLPVRLASATASKSPA